MDSFDIDLDTELKLVRVTVSGNMQQKDGEKIISTARRTAAEHRFDILNDIRQATTKVSLANWFQLPKTLDVLKKPETRHIKAAIIFSPADSVEDYRFYEDVSKNMGLRIRFFLTESEAVSWIGTMS